MDIRIHLKKTDDGYLATVRSLTLAEVKFHRVRLPKEVDPWQMHGELVGLAVAKIGSASTEQTVTMQMPLPGMGR